MQEIFAAFSNAETSEALFTENLKTILDDLTKTHGFALSPDDPQGIEYVYRNFQQYGPGAHLLDERARRRFRPQLAVVRGSDARPPTRPALPAAIWRPTRTSRCSKALETRNLLIPVVGNFAGPKAIRAVGHVPQGTACGRVGVLSVERRAVPEHGWTLGDVLLERRDAAPRRIEPLHQVGPSGSIRVRTRALVDPRNHVRRDQDLRKPDGHHAAVARTAIARATAQNVSLTASCIVRGSLARLEIVPNVGGVVMSLFGSPKFVVLNTIEDVPPQRGATRAARS